MAKRILCLIMTVMMLAGIFVINTSAVENSASVVETENVIFYYDNYRFTSEITFSSVSQDITAYLAVYNANNKLIRCVQENVLNGAQTAKISMIADESYVGMTYKLFLWDSSSLTPQKNIISGTVHNKAAVQPKAFMDFVNSGEVTKEGLNLLLEECNATGLIDAHSFLELPKTSREQICEELIKTKCTDLRAFYCELMLACGTPANDIIKIKAEVVATAIS